MSKEVEKTPESAKRKVIHLRGISCMNGDRLILSNINWEVHPREHWAIVGLNGSGKTTLLSMLTGYAWASSGKISVLGKRLGSYDIRELRKRIGWVSSSLQEKFYTDETAEEIVLSGKYATIGLYDRPKSRDTDSARSLMIQLRCDQVAAQPYGTLSQGEKQKVLIARALINSPRLLILDEPCAGLDIFSREQLLQLLEDLGQQEKAPTLLYVSHRVEEILPVFTHTLLLRRGEIHSQGETGEILTERNLSDFFETSVDVRRRNGRVWVRV